MPKATKKRTQTKALTRKKKLSAADMKKVKGGHNYLQSLTTTKDLGAGLLLPAVQKVRES
jgi:hypothetical protein